MNQDLQDLRQQLDEIDQNLVELLAKRFEITQKVGQYKAQNNLPPQDKNREQEKFDRLTKLSTEAGVNPELVIGIMKLIIEEVLVNHRKLQADSN